MKEFVHQGLAALVLGTAAAIGVNSDHSALASQHIEERISSHQLLLESTAAEANNLNDTQKAGITFIVSAEILAVTLMGYKFSEGTIGKVGKIEWEKLGWNYGVPSLNLVGASMLLYELWK